jgi:hypothetical protein
MILNRLILLLGAGVLLTPGWAQAPATQTEKQSIEAYTAALRKDLRTERQAIVDQAMRLEAGDKAKFWGVYDRYQKELTSLWDQRIANVKKYAQNYDSLTDPVADELAATAMKNEQAGTALRHRYYGEMKKALGSKVAARFLQVETALGSLANLQMTSQLPLIQ